MLACVFKTWVHFLLEEEEEWDLPSLERNKGEEKKITAPPPPIKLSAGQCDDSSSVLLKSMLMLDPFAVLSFYRSACHFKLVLYVTDVFPWQQGPQGMMGYSGCVYTAQMPCD